MGTSARAKTAVALRHVAFQLRRDTAHWAPMLETQGRGFFDAWFHSILQA